MFAKGGATSINPNQENFLGKFGGFLLCLVALIVVIILFIKYFNRKPPDSMRSQPWLPNFTDGEQAGVSRPEAGAEAGFGGTTA